MTKEEIKAAYHAGSMYIASAIEALIALGMSYREAEDYLD